LHADELVRCAAERRARLGDDPLHLREHGPSAAARAPSASVTTDAAGRWPGRTPPSRRPHERELARRDERESRRAAPAGGDRDVVHDERPGAGRERGGPEHDAGDLDAELAPELLAQRRERLPHRPAVVRARRSEEVLSQLEDDRSGRCERIDVGVARLGRGSGVAVAPSGEVERAARRGGRERREGRGREPRGEREGGKERRHRRERRRVGGELSADLAAE
jgi:hypothetical protein